MGELYVPEFFRTARLSDQRPSGPLADGTSVTLDASGTPHQVGSYVEVDASLSVDCSGVTIRNVNNNNTAGADTATILEIGIGANGAETLWARVNIGYTNAGTIFHIPGYIPAGTRVAARIRSVVASKQVVERFSFVPVMNGLKPQTTPQSIGFDTANSRGTVLTYAGAINTEGAWTQLVAATTQPIDLLAVMPGLAGSSAVSDATLRIDIAVGAAAAEQAILTDVAFEVNTNEAILPRYVMTYGVSIPTGSRISARYQTTVANAVDLALVGA